MELSNLRMVVSRSVLVSFINDIVYNPVVFPYISGCIGYNQTDAVSILQLHTSVDSSTAQLVYYTTTTGSSVPPHEVPYTGVIVITHKGCLPSTNDSSLSNPGMYKPMEESTLSGQYIYMEDLKLTSQCACTTKCFPCHQNSV